MWDWFKTNISAVQGVAAVAQGLAAIANLVVAAVLAWLTARYVSLTRAQVATIMSEKSRADSAELQRAHLYIARFRAIMDQLPHSESELSSLTRFKLWRKPEVQRLVDAAIFIAPMTGHQVGQVQEHLDAILDEQERLMLNSALPGDYGTYNRSLVQAKMALDDLEASLGHLLLARPL